MKLRTVEHVFLICQLLGNLVSFKPLVENNGFLVASCHQFTGNSASICRILRVLLNVLVKLMSSTNRVVTRAILNSCFLQFKVADFAQLLDENCNGCIKFSGAKIHPNASLTDTLSTSFQNAKMTLV